MEKKKKEPLPQISVKSCWSQRVPHYFFKLKQSPAKITEDLIGLLKPDFVLLVSLYNSFFM